MTFDLRKFISENKTPQHEGTNFDPKSQYNIWVTAYETVDGIVINPTYSSRGWGEQIKSQIESYGDKGGYPIKAYAYILPPGQSMGESSFTFDVIDGGEIDNIELTNWKIKGLDEIGLKSLLQTVSELDEELDKEKDFPISSRRLDNDVDYYIHNESDEFEKVYTVKNRGERKMSKSFPNYEAAADYLNTLK